jgi:L-alanine-DL-glutamate epimerase-like enolase superfamily enzyme
MSHGRHLTALQSTVVRVDGEDGTPGYGEACTLGRNYIDAFPTGLHAAVRALAEVVVGHEVFAPDALNHAMDRALYGNLSAKAAIDAATWDLRGKILGQPVSALLGGRHRDTYPVFFPLSLASPQEMAREAKEQQQKDGYHCWQLKIGEDPYDDAERVRAVLEAVGAEATYVTSDANAGWTTAQALQFVTAIAGLHTFVEQPCPTLAQVADVRRHTASPVVIDEAVRDMGNLVECYEQRAADCVNIKPARVGGPTRAARLRDVAQALGYKVMVDDPMGGEISTSMVGHLAVTCRPEHLAAASFLQVFTTKRLASGGATLSDGWGHAPTEPGWGIEVDEDALGEPIFTLGG